MPTIVQPEERRITKTPNATMVTFVSPTLGESPSLSMWQVNMRRGSSGPAHRFDSEQIWTVVEGRIQLEVDEEELDLDVGDTVAIAADSLRQISSPADSKLLVCGRGDARASVPGEPESRGVPLWIS